MQMWQLAYELNSNGNCAGRILCYTSYLGFSTGQHTLSAQTVA
jgi:hypothetical protein